MNAPSSSDPSIASEILRLCNGDTIPAPALDAHEEAPMSSIKEHLRTGEPRFDTIPAPPPTSPGGAEDVELEDEAPSTLPSPPGYPRAVI